jgi:peptidoglycan biosynthesis protein MviN/MurJ (putative lipid II flippase)
MFEAFLMGEKKKPIKLFSWRIGIAMGIAMCAGVTLSTYRSYTRKVYIDKVDIACTIFAVLICLGICLGVAWWGNRPEKEE